MTETTRKATERLEPHLLRAFLEVADTGTISAAAGRLHRTQAAVSMQIRSLEQEIGERLFERSTKGLRLNQAGRRLRPYAEELLSLAERAFSSVRGDLYVGRARLGVVEDFAATALIDLLRTFRLRHPDVHIDIIVTGNRELGSMLAEDKLDIAVCDTGAVAQRPVVSWVENLHWVGRKDDQLELSSLPIVMFAEDCLWRSPTLAALAKLRTPWHVICETSTLVAVSAAVRAGIGIAPMMRDTIPENCGRLHGIGALIAPICVDIGLYLNPQAAAEARILCSFLGDGIRSQIPISDAAAAEVPTV